jgi:hypothetical protein
VKGSGKYFMDVVRKDKKTGKRYVLREDPVAPGELGTPHMFDPTAPRTKLTMIPPPRTARSKKNEVVTDNRRLVQPDLFESLKPKKK